ncbi:MAG TPA: choice-of-anchor J domain-containing protein [Bacteroidales bacterium]|nr:choice-of-anchor J domain-containing protein [Bacteroidales bacterium]
MFHPQPLPLHTVPNITVFISTTGNDPANFTMLFEETLSTTIPGWELQPRELDINNYGGQTVYVAFRHWNITDMDRVVIDNVKLKIVEAGQADVLLLNEDFQAGIDDPAGENWLPAGWSKLDADGDGRNWFFGVRQNNAAMRSESWATNPLTPNNWLITPQVYVGFVGNAENSAPKVTVYPNPAADYLNISSQNDIQQLTITDLRGRKVFETTPTNHVMRISVEHLPAGFYLLRMITSEGTIDKKIQVRR